MKTLQIDLIIEELGDLDININPDFLNKDQLDVPILKQVDLLLDAVGEKGLKLTAKGNLPTKVVKEITLCCPTPSDRRFLKNTNRFLEGEQVSVMRARVVSEVGKLLKVSKGKIYLGSMAEAFRSASQAEKFIYLIWQSSKVNLAYFDRMQESSLINGISFILMQVVRDKAKMFREANVYSAFLLDAFPKLADVVEEEIEPSSYFSKDPYDEFEYMVELRLFKNFFVPFGLAEERGVDYGENYECCKTELLESFLMPVDVVDTSIILSKKTFHQFAQRIKKEKLDIDLFYDFCFIYTNFARYPYEPSAIIAKDLVKSKRVIGTAAAAQEAFYTDLSNAAEQTIKHFTRLEVKGGGDRGDEMQKEFLSFVDGIYALLPKDKPFKMLDALMLGSFFLLDILVKVYGIDTMSPDFHGECRKHFDEETVEDIGSSLLHMGDLKKKAKKFKRINAKMEEMVKEALITFVLAVMSMHTYEMDK
ncbi:MAG: hypothetical protein U9Q90_08165 [Campylobacterota bacterium]|nr:hypothetical protein [Campylobacterota bacterium]